MDPTSVAKALRAVAQGVELSEEPSVSSVASSLEDVLGMIESDDPAVRVALFGGIKNKLKNTKRKVFNTKRERKILDKIDRLTELGKKAQKLSKMLPNGEDFSSIMSDEGLAAAMLGAREFIDGGSEKLQEAVGAEDDDEAEMLLSELDDHYEDADDEDDEDGDREVLSDACRQFAEKCAGRIKDLKGKVKKKKPEKKKPEAEAEEPEGQDVDLSQLG